MKLSLKALIAALTVCGLLSQPALAHKFHESLTQLEYNEQARTVELSLRLFADDLEEILSKRARKKVRIDKAQDSEARTLAYIQDSFELEGRDGKAKTFRWVGMEINVDVVWVYVETDMPEGLDQARLRNRIFFDLFDDQINRVNVKSGGTRAFFVFKPGDQLGQFRAL
jgi:hypothetical protein